MFLGECRRVLRQDRHIYIMFDSFSMLSLGALVRDFFDVKGVVVWDKVHLGMGHYFRRRHEQIVFASKGRRKAVASRPARRMGRPTHPPRDISNAETRQALRVTWCRPAPSPGFLVCDPFCGSGSSGIAALLGGCDFIGADIDSRAVDIAEDRLTRFMATGQDPLEPRSPASRSS